MSEIAGLYQELIVDHSREPHNFRVLPAADRKAEGHNPLCGDEVTVYLKMDGDRISEIAFQGSGCAISKASASLMTESVRRKTIDEVIQLFGQFHKMVTGEADSNFDPESLGKLAVFSGVWQYPVRVKCATMAWHTLRAALDSKKEVMM